MQGKVRPVVIFFCNWTGYYSSLAEASRQTGISRWRLLRGLEDRDGMIPNSRPPAYIDEAFCPNDIATEADGESGHVRKPHKSSCRF